MNCIKFKDKLPLLFLGELEPIEQEKIEQHLETCETCRTELEELKEVIGILNDDARDNLDDLEQLKLEKEIYRKLATRSLQDNDPPFGRVFWLLVRIAAVVVIFLAGYTAYPLISRQHDNGPLNSRIEKSFDSEDELIESLGSRRFTAEGLLVIAKGKSALRK